MTQSLIKIKYIFPEDKIVLFSMGPNSPCICLNMFQVSIQPLTHIHILVAVTTLHSTICSSTGAIPARAHPTVVKHQKQFRVQYLVQGCFNTTRVLKPSNQRYPFYQLNYTVVFTWYTVYTYTGRQMVENRSEQEHNEAAWLGWCLDNIAAQRECKLHKLSPVPCQCSLAEREQAHLLRLFTNTTPAPLLPSAHTPTHTYIFTLNTYSTSLKKPFASSSHFTIKHSASYNQKRKTHV